MSVQKNSAAKPFISAVSGCFNEAENIAEFIERVTRQLEQIENIDWELILIDNASTDGTPEILRQFAADEPRLKVILNARNFGHVRSSYYGLLQSRGNAVLFLASDLQDPPEMIPQFIEQWRKGFKAVVAIKAQSDETPVFFFIRRLYYKLVHRLADIDTIENFTGFGLYDRQIVDICRQMEDPYPYFRGMISEIGLPTAKIPYHQPNRKRGITKNNFYTLYDIAMLGLTSHSKIPLRLAAMLGFAMSFASLGIALGYLIYKLLYWDRFSLGVAPVIIGLFLISSVQLFFIGVLGEYIGAIHTQVLKRPLVVERERINF